MSGVSSTMYSIYIHPTNIFTSLPGITIRIFTMFSKASGPIKDPNGTVRATSVPRKTSQLRKQSKNIAAIDFGTKNCSLAFITENDKLEITRGIPKLPLNGTYLRVPTVVLFNSSGQVEAFGHDARTLYSNLEDHEREEYVYFEEIKMNLHQDQVLLLNLESGVC